MLPLWRLFRRALSVSHGRRASCLLSGSFRGKSVRSRDIARRAKDEIRRIFSWRIDRPTFDSGRFTCGALEGGNGSSTVGCIRRLRKFRIRRYRPFKCRPLIADFRKSKRINQYYRSTITARLHFLAVSKRRHEGQESRSFRYDRKRSDLTLLIATPRKTHGHPVSIAPTANAAAKNTDASGIHVQ